MEIKELDFLENLSGNDKKTSVINSVIGGHDDDSSYIYDLLDYFLAPIFEKEREETEPKPRSVRRPRSASSLAGIPKSPFE